MFPKMELRGTFRSRGNKTHGPVIKCFGRTEKVRDSSPTFSVRPCSSVGRVTVDLIRRSWVRFPPRSKDIFFASCGSLFPFTRANAQWVIHGFK